MVTPVPRPSDPGSQLPAELRTFVAVELPEPVLAALSESQAALTARIVRLGAGRGVRWVNPSGVHLTLKFLGRTSSSLLPEIESRLTAALAGQRRFPLELSSLGVFPSFRAPRVLWVGLAGDLAALSEVQAKVEEVIAPLGFPTESRPFSPHLTLARVDEAASAADRQLVGEVVRDYGPAPRRGFVVSEVSLMRSELSPSGARYSRLLGVPLSPAT